MKKILITGARSGIIGEVIKRIKEDYFIYVTVHTESQLKKVKEKAIQGIHKKAVIKAPKKQLKKYKKLFSKKAGFRKGMKVKK